MAAPMITADEERRRRQRRRSVAIGLALGALVVLFYVATLVRLGPNALRKDGMRSSHQTPAATVATPASPGTAPGDAQSDCRKTGKCP